MVINYLASLDFRNTAGIESRSGLYAGFFLCLKTQNGPSHCPDGESNRLCDFDSLIGRVLKELAKFPPKPQGGNLIIGSGPPALTLDEIPDLVSLYLAVARNPLNWGSFELGDPLYDQMTGRFP